MKKKQRKVIDPPITGKDELNIIECPLTLLTEKPEENQKTLESTDKQDGIIRHWKITGSEEYGLPCALDEPVFIAMLAFTKREEFKSQTVFFNQLEMLKLMRWANNGDSYHRLSLAFSRFAAVTIETDYLWNKGTFENGKFTFHVLDDSSLYHGKKRNTKSSSFKWGDKIFNIFLKENFKNLDLDIYFDLETPISRRFYRILDKWLYKKDHVSFNLKNLCHERIGISRKLFYPSSLKQKLSPSLDEYKTKNLISSAIYIKSKNKNWLLKIERFKENPELPQDPLTQTLISLGIPSTKSATILQKYPRDLVESWIMALDIIKPKPRNKAGYLLKAMEGKWDLPDEVKKQREIKKREKETELLNQWAQLVRDQLEPKLKEQGRTLREELRDHVNRYYDRTLGDPFWQDFEKHNGQERAITFHYLQEKAKEIGFTSFDEWKQEETRS